MPVSDGTWYMPAVLTGVGFLKMLQVKVRVIILSLSLKANFWITDENNIAGIPHMPVHPAIEISLL